MEVNRKKPVSFSKIWKYVREGNHMDKFQPDFLYITPQNHHDIEIIQCGTHECAPGNTYGPAVRDIYLIHYIVTGKGYFNDSTTIHPLSTGDMFLITPDNVTVYYADMIEP